MDRARAVVPSRARSVEAGDELIVITWLHESRRDVLKTHPRGDTSAPLTGVFATRSPDRPNPLGLHPVTVLEIAGRELKVGPLKQSTERQSSTSSPSFEHRPTGRFDRPGESRSRVGGRALRVVLPCARAPCSFPAVCHRRPAGAGARRSDCGRPRGGRGARGISVADRAARGADGAAARRAPLLAARGLRGHRGRVDRDPPRGRRHLRPGRARRDLHARCSLRAAGHAVPASPRFCCWRPPTPS